MSGSSLQKRYRHRSRWHELIRDEIYCRVKYKYKISVMGDPHIPTEAQDLPGVPFIAEKGHSQLFAKPLHEPSNRGKIIGIVVALTLLAVLALAFWGRGGRTITPVVQNAVLPRDPYASNLAFTQLAMSESTSLSGGKSTFIDGHVKNAGPENLSGITMQVLFRNDIGLSPQVETLPLTLIRTREPYVDTEPISAAPLKPGDEAEFRLIFETVNANWNQQMPELLVVHVARR